MTASQESRAQRLLNIAAEAQMEHWEFCTDETSEEFTDAINALESELGIPIDKDTDLSEETVETLLGQVV